MEKTEGISVPIIRSKELQQYMFIYTFDFLKDKLDLLRGSRVFKSSATL